MKPRFEKIGFDGFTRGTVAWFPGNSGLTRGTVRFHHEDRQSHRRDRILDFGAAVQSISHISHRSRS